MRKVLFAVLIPASFLCACNNGNSTPDQSLQITEKDLIHLEGSFENNFLESWEYIQLEGDNPDALMPDIEGVLYDDGLLFVRSTMYGSYNDRQTLIKVFDRSGKYLNDIGRQGRAKNEYLSFCDWAINTRSNEVIVFDNFAWCLKRYDYKGNFIGQTELARNTPQDGFYGMEMEKCLSDGSILYHGGLAILPSHEYFHINPDGTYQSPYRMTEYLLHCDMDPSEFIELRGEVAVTDITSCWSDITSDTTYLLRALDNHIYMIYGDSMECVANMAFMPDMPYKMKCDYDYENDDQYMGYSIPNFFYDMKDYVYIWYIHDNEYLFDKRTSKMYHMNHDTLHVSLPEMIVSISGNTLIGWSPDYYINDAVNLMDSPDYDHRFTPEVEAFYRKAAKSDNPAIIIARFKENAPD